MKPGHLLLVAAIASLAPAAIAQTPAPRPTASSASTGDFNAEGDVSANAVIGAKIRTPERETVGTIQDLYVDRSGSIKTVVIAVGGFLGVGSKDVAVNWSDIKHTRDGQTALLTTGLSRDQLRAMPDYKPSAPK